MLTVGIASGDTTSSAQLLASLEQTGVVKLVKQWTIPDDNGHDPGDTLPDIVFLDLSRDPGPYFEFGAHIRRIRPTIKLVACSAITPPTPQLLLEAMRSGVQDFLPKPVGVAALTEILSRLVTDRDPVERVSNDKLIVVMGSKGGVGATTVAVNLASQLCSSAGKRTVLLDFARPLGNIHLMLDLHPRFCVRDAVANLERLDSHFFGGLLTTHTSKLEVLAGATQPEEWEAIAVPPLERVLNVAQSSFDMVVVDVGVQFSSEWSSVLRMARTVLLVTEVSVPSLWALERRLAALNGFGLGPDRTQVIINRWHKSDEQSIKAIQKNINRPILAYLPNDYRKASEAINIGTPILQNHNNALSNRYRDLAAQLAGVEIRAVAKKPTLSTLFSFR